MKQLFTGGLVLVLITSVLSGCLKSSNTQQEYFTYPFLMHAAVTAPSVDLYFNDAKLSGITLDYEKAGYSQMKPGIYEVDLKKGGGDSLVASIPAARYDTLESNTILLYSDLDGTAKATKIYDRVLDGKQDKMYFRFWHLGYEVDAVDFYLGDTKVAANRTSTDNVDINSYNVFSETNGGVFKLTVKEAGTETVLATTTTDVSLSNNAAWTVFLKGKKNGTGKQALSIGVVKNF